MLRYDVYDPNTDVDNDDSAKLYAGFTRDFTKKISAGLLYERQTSKSTDDAGAVSDEWHGKSSRCKLVSMTDRWVCRLWRHAQTPPCLR